MAKKMSRAGAGLLNEVKRIKAGGKAKVWSAEQLAVLNVRKELGVSQQEFSRLLGVPVGTIRDWEQGRKQPDSAALTLIKVAEKYPEILASLVA
jgi:putative transcriptional regulator